MKLNLFFVIQHPLEFKVISLLALGRVATWWSVKHFFLLYFFMPVLKIETGVFDYHEKHNPQRVSSIKCHSFLLLAPFLFPAPFFSSPSHIHLHWNPNVPRWNAICCLMKRYKKSCLTWTNEEIYCAVDKLQVTKIYNYLNKNVNQCKL